MNELTTRNASLEDLATLLQDQHARKIDMVVPADKMTARGGVLVVEGADVVLDDDGVTPTDGRYVPTDICDEGVATKLGIPVGYLKKLRADRVDLYDANVNGWLHGTPDAADYRNVDPDSRSFLLRAFRGDDGDGVARALLSDRYGIIDNLDVLTAALDGVKQAGVDVNFTGCDLTDRRMYVRIAAPEVAALAPTLLKGYRSPYTPDGRLPGGDDSTVFAGIEISNSETGGGSFSIVPRIVVLACTNGLTITKDALTRVHVGSRMEEGVIRWTKDTERKELDLITARARDAVATFLDVDYVTMVIDALEEKAGTPITGKVDEKVKTVCKRLRFSDDHTASILDHFIRGGQVTAGGVMQAITAFAQEVPDADSAHDLEAVAVKALDLAAAG